MNRDNIRLSRKSSKHPREQQKEVTDKNYYMETNKKESNSKTKVNFFRQFEESNYENEEGVDHQESMQIYSMLKKNFLDLNKITPKTPLQIQKQQSDKSQAKLNPPEPIEERKVVENEDFKGEDDKTVILINEGLDNGVYINHSDQKDLTNKCQEEMSTKPNTCTKEKMDSEKTLCLSENESRGEDEQLQQKFEQTPKKVDVPASCFNVIEISDDEEPSHSPVYKLTERRSNKREMTSPYKDDVIKKKIKPCSASESIKLAHERAEAKKKTARDLEKENEALRAALQKKKI